uniref:ragulator complex protein LAMTOR1 isoform X1 n=1 Tax=Myxine glutinosa TaxID=7769 RepID=UPI00358EB1AC
MGCCFGKEDSNAEQQSDERKPLLDPTSTFPNRRPSSSDFPSRNLPAAVTSQQQDEHSHMNRILVTTAHNIIDVCAVESQGVEQHEYMDRARQYSSRLSMRPPQQPTRPSLPALTSQPLQVLSSRPVPPADIQLVCRIASLAAQARAQLCVASSDELVVPFARA